MPCWLITLKSALGGIESSTLVYTVYAGYVLKSALGGIESILFDVFHPHLQGLKSALGGIERTELKIMLL